MASKTEVALTQTDKDWGEQPLAVSPTEYDGGLSLIDPKSLPMLATILSETFAAAQLFDSSARGLVSSTADLARLSFDARSLCLLQSGAIDWAGKSKAYNALYADRLRWYCTGSLDTGGLGMTTDEFDKVRSKVTSWVNDNDYRNLYIAQFGAKHDPEVAKVADKVGAKLALPAAAAKYVTEQVRSQKSKGGKGAQLSGWNPADAPKGGQKVGLSKQERQNALSSQNRTGNNATENTAESQFEKVRNAISKVVTDGDSKAPWLAALYSTDNVFRVVSVLSERLVGTHDKPMPKGITEKPKVIGGLRNIAALATMTADLLDSKTAEQVDRAALDKLRYQNQS